MFVGVIFVILCPFSPCLIVVFVFYIIMEVDSPDTNNHGNSPNQSTDPTEKEGVPANVPPKNDDDDGDDARADSPESTDAAAVAEEEMEATPATTSTASATKALCLFCQKRNASKDCPETACTACCPAASCPKHAAVRAKQAWRQQVLEGRTPEQLLAAEKRKAILPKHRFRESRFVYTGDTVVIWNLREYYYNGNPKWRDDARRRAKRRQQIAQDAVNVVHDDVSKYPYRRLYCSRQRFRKWVESKYQEALTKETMRQDKDQQSS